MITGVCLEGCVRERLLLLASCLWCLSERCESSVLLHGCVEQQREWGQPWPSM